MKQLELVQLEALQGGRKKDSTLCAIGIAIVLAGTIALNPLVIIEGGLVVNEYC